LQSLRLSFVVELVSFYTGMSCIGKPQTEPRNNPPTRKNAFQHRHQQTREEGEQVIATYHDRASDFPVLHFDFGGADHHRFRFRKARAKSVFKKKKPKKKEEEEKTAA
jgi:hypothetical protein